MADDSFTRNTEAFLSWFQELPGATFHNDIEIVDLRQRDAGRGIVAKRKISAETVLFKIPRNGILSVSSSDLCTKLPDAFTTTEEQWDSDNETNEQASGLDPWAALILVMIYEYLRPDSMWRPYFDVLPQTFETLMFWTDNELKELQASVVAARIGKAEADNMFRSKILPLLGAHPEVFGNSEIVSDETAALRLCHRMGSAIMAYAFDLDSPDEDNNAEEDGWIEDNDHKTTLGMVPMADILNADAEFNAHVNHGEDTLTVTTLRDIEAGEEILNYYGPHPNSELLRRYGYTTAKHARYDVVEVSWELVSSSLRELLGVSQETWKVAMSTIDAEELEESFVLERESGEPDSSGRFVGEARFEQLPEELEEQLKLALKGLRKAYPALMPDKRKRDEILRTAVKRSLEAKLAQYGTSYSSDEELLSSPGLTPRQRMAVQVRSGEKRLLLEALEYLQCAGNEQASFDDDQPPAKKPRT